MEEKSKEKSSREKGGKGVKGVKGVKGEKNEPKPNGVVCGNPQYSNLTI